MSDKTFVAMAHTALNIIMGSGRKIIECHIDPAFVPPTFGYPPVNPAFDHIFAVGPTLWVTTRYGTDERVACYSGLDGPDHVTVKLVMPHVVHRTIGIFARDIAGLDAAGLAKRIAP
jgi:hypothetical protein